MAFITKKEFQRMQDQIISIHYKLKTRKISINNLIEFKTLISDYMMAIATAHREEVNADGLYAALMLCLDQYTYSETGEVFVPDRIYDIVHNIYLQMGCSQLVYPDHLESRWNMKVHKRPDLVGSIRKVYTIDDMKLYIRDICNKNNRHLEDIEWIISPKYDGISACLEFRNHKLVEALTRGDVDGAGRKGQDITPLAQSLMNIRDLEKIIENGFLKVELLCPQSSFEHLKNEYRNRRSATTGIVNSPKNVGYGHFIYAMPLLLDMEDNRGIFYIPENSEKISNCTDTKYIIHTMMEIMHKIRSKDFPYRVDGVILYPVLPRDRTDIMANSMAFKINTAENQSRVEYGYVSVGRAGKAIPMLKVEPCEVNETIVTDVSLGSFQMFYNMHLMEEEVVTIFSAGDVIPQARLSNPRIYPKDADELRIREICPYCGKPLVNYFCKNPDCPRIITGAITNFLVKLGIPNMADGTIEALRKANLVHTIPDIFTLREDMIAKLPGFGELSAESIIHSIHDLERRPISYPVFFGALGVPGASLKTWEKIFDIIPPEELIDEMEDFYEGGSLPKNYRKYSNLYFRLMDCDGIGTEKRDKIIEYLEKKWGEIRKLLKYMNLVTGRITEGEVVFTGFRDAIWAEKFDALGFRVADAVTRKTVCVIASSMSTTKAQKARDLGIALFPSYEIDQAYEWCKKWLDDKHDVSRMMERILAAESFYD